jgi:hypothetical protein
MLVASMGVVCNLGSFMGCFGIYIHRGVLRGGRRSAAAELPDIRLGNYSPASDYDLSLYGMDCPIVIFLCRNSWKPPFSTQ